MALEGTAYVTGADGRQPIEEGTLLKSGDTLEVESGAYADLAYDKDWNNVVRVEENSASLDERHL